MGLDFARGCNNRAVGRGRTRRKTEELITRGPHMGNVALRAMPVPPAPCPSQCARVEADCVRGAVRRLPTVVTGPEFFRDSTGAVSRATVRVPAAGNPGGGLGCRQMRKAKKVLRSATEGAVNVPLLPHSGADDYGGGGGGGGGAGPAAATAKQRLRADRFAAAVRRAPSSGPAAAGGGGGGSSSRRAPTCARRR